MILVTISMTEERHTDDIKVAFFFGCSTMISTGRTRQDSDKQFSARETLEKNMRQKIFLASQVDHVTGNQSSKLLKMTEKTGFLRITGEPVIIGEKEKNPAFQIRLRLRCKKPFVAIQSSSLRTDTPQVEQPKKKRP